MEPPLGQVHGAVVHRARAQGKSKEKNCCSIWQSCVDVVQLVVMTFKANGGGLTTAVQVVQAQKW